MEKYINNYLNEYYYIDTSEVGNDGIYDKNDLRKYKAPKNGDKLLKELVTIFYVDEVQLKSWVDTWAISIKSDIDLEFYWKSNEDFIFPIAHQVAATTIGFDLVQVQPMAAPRGELLYMDFVYGVDPATGDSETVSAITVVGRHGAINRNGRVYDEEIFRQSWGEIAQLYENQQNHIVGELDHPIPDINIEINDRDDSLVYSTLQKWQSLIGISSRRSDD